MSVPQEHAGEEAAAEASTAEDRAAEDVEAKDLAAEAGSAKAEGNALFGEGKYLEAVECYTIALEVAGENSELSELRAMCHSNKAICFIHLVAHHLQFHRRLSYPACRHASCSASAQFPTFVLCRVI